ncbi:MAG: domain containing protein [Rhizobium sp.]|nr:domain containing protein [Rhizobium sp.]
MVKLVHAYGLQDVQLASLYPETDVNLTTHSGKRAVLEFANGYEIDIVGKNLSYEGLAITGGKLGSIVFRDPQGNAIATATDLKDFTAFSVYDSIANGSDADLHPFLFGDDDLIIGSGGNDMLLGYGGHDKLRGNNGDDTLRAGSGADMLNGGHGSDNLDGGAGTDALIGGFGADTFVATAAMGHDTVKDFDWEGANHDWIENTSGLEATWERDGNDTVIHFGTDDTMRLVNVKPWHFSSDFIVSEIV